MTSDATDAEDKLIDEIRDLHASAWAGEAPPATRKEGYQRAMLDTMRSLSVELLRLGVTSAILEGAYLLWWLRLACVNHRFAEGGFERSLKRIGPLVGPISEILVRVGEKVEAEAPSPELQRLGEKIEALRIRAGGAVATWPKSGEDELAQTEIANTYLQKTLAMALDVGIPGDVLESLLLYFWFRSNTNRNGLPEAFFQKVERHWDTAMEEIGRYLEEQAAADRRLV